MAGTIHHDLERFLKAQAPVYDQALAELRGGRKRTHWIWFIFPQIDGLGHSSTSRHYAIKDLEEARAYLQHPLLSSRLVECAQAVLAVESRTASDIFPYPDDLKLRSSMTLFECVEHPGSVFAQVLEKYFQGKRDERTIQLLKRPR
ncbi:MAG: calpastatin [Spirochaetes bacterium RBG_16_67_19]|nr:MAG: calpastatin [Spirochaetes bacterium GWB1_66_5]OHD76798.1 MAG: calpastatin [Spirochaetes bacterium RBG_16_67_19]